MGWFAQLNIYINTIYKYESFTQEAISSNIDNDSKYTKVIE